MRLIGVQVRIIQEIRRRDRITFLQHRDRSTGNRLAFLRQDIGPHRLTKQRMHELARLENPAALEAILNHAQGLLFKATNLQPELIIGLERQHRFDRQGQTGLSILPDGAKVMTDHRLDTVRHGFTVRFAPTPTPPIAPQKTHARQMPKILEREQRIATRLRLYPSDRLGRQRRTRFRLEQTSGLLPSQRLEVQRHERRRRWRATGDDQAHTPGATNHQRQRRPQFQTLRRDLVQVFDAQHERRETRQPCREHIGQRFRLDVLATLERFDLP